MRYFCIPIFSLSALVLKEKLSFKSYFAYFLKVKKFVSLVTNKHVWSVLKKRGQGPPLTQRL